MVRWLQFNAIKAFLSSQMGFTALLGILAQNWLPQAYINLISATEDIRDLILVPKCSWECLESVTNKIKALF